MEDANRIGQSEKQRGEGFSEQQMKEMNIFTMIGVIELICSDCGASIVHHKLDHH